MINLRKFKNVEYVFPISCKNKLAKIVCHHENLEQRSHKHEVYFLNAIMKVIAYFEAPEPFYVEQLSKQNENLYLVKDIFTREYKIVRVENCKHEIIYSCQNIELTAEDGCFGVKNNNLWGFIAEDGIEIIKPQYEDYCAFSSNLAAVKKDGKWGFINKSNDTVIPFEFEIPYFSSFLGDFAPIGKNEKFGYIDKNGKIIIPFNYEETFITYPNAQIFPAKNNGKWGFIDVNEKVVVPFEYDDIDTHSDAYPYYSVIKCGNSAKENPTFDTYGLVDPIAGKLIIPCVYNLLRPNPNSICVAIITENKEKKYGLIDYHNNKITDFIYDEIGDYSNEAFYTARLNKYWGYIDEKGNNIVDFNYTKLDLFYGCFALAWNKEYIPLLINKKGEEIQNLNNKSEIYNLGCAYALVLKSKALEYEIVKLF